MPRLVAECVTIEEFERLRHERSQDQRTPTGQKNQQKNQQNPSGKRFFSTILGRYVMILLQFVVTVTVGAIFFKANPREGGDMTWVDSFYFAVVTSTAVGYGDITPQSVGGKIFSIPYMFFSTLIVGKLVAQFIKLYVNETVGERITQEILESVVYIFKADIEGHGFVSETDYVLFKLHQLQKIDKRIERELVSRFQALDVGGEGFLDLGVDVPSAAQVQALGDMNLLGSESTDEAMEVWRTQMCPPVPAEKSDLGAKLSIANCHEFFWSPLLWQYASREIATVFLVSFVFYSLVGGYLCASEDLDLLDSIYLFAQTVTMVGLGDLSPSKQISRAAAIVLIPFGIVIITIGISYLAAARLSQPHNSATDNVAAGFRRFQDDNQILERSGISRLKIWIQETDAGKMTTVLLKFVAVIFSGALFFYLSGSFEDIDTFTDALFFASLIACTVGYGHKIWPVEQGGKIFLVFYFVISSVIVAKLLREFSVIYSNMGPNDELIMDSILWVHLADLEMKGKISQAGWILFKLRQMQRVDDRLVQRIVLRFKEIDDNNTGSLEIGVDVPSGAQVEQMKKESNYTHPGETLFEQNFDVMKLWHKIRPKLVADRDEFKRSNRKIQHEKKKKKKIQRGSPIKLMDSHDFEWSTKLWNEQANNTMRTASFCLVVYFVWSFILMWVIETEDVTALDAVYCSMATLATVGYGDFAPTRQLNRGMSIVAMPFGLAIIGVIISYFEAKANTYRPPVTLDPRCGTFTLEEEDDETGLGGGQEEAERRKEAMTSPLVKFAQTEKGFHSLLVHEGGLKDADDVTAGNSDLWYWIEGTLGRTVKEFNDPLDDLKNGADAAEENL